MVKIFRKVSNRFLIVNNFHNFIFIYKSSTMLIILAQTSPRMYEMHNKVDYQKTSTIKSTWRKK